MERATRGSRSSASKPEHALLIANAENAGGRGAGTGQREAEEEVPTRGSVALACSPGSSSSRRRKRAA
eukprot:353334-Rhodomonas_salina.1